MKRKILVTLGILFGLTGLVAASAAFWYQHNFHASPFRPVQLSPAEQAALDKKLGAPEAPDPAKTIVLSEREINGWLEKHDLGEHVKVSVGPGGIAATALLPLDNDIPLIGGNTVRFKLALRPQFSATHHLGLFVSDITVGGISPPNAWLGGIKGRDLLAETDVSRDPVARSFAEGIKSVDLRSGEIRVVLND